VKNSIAVAVSLDQVLEAEDVYPKKGQDKKRLLVISILSICIAVCISGIAKLLVYLIDIITNISFYGKFSFVHSSPANNALGIWVIAIPVAGGLVVGLMALYGSKAIRGHGIPEAMEQILTNQSKIKPAITFLKPVSAAISIGTGGPFGAEGPIIATGGAFGSTLGQLLKITHNERKILLAAGATAGMSAIFNSPIAAIFLAIELLLFEFSPRSIIPVALACITGAAGHQFLFGEGAVFSMSKVIAPASNSALFAYSIIGVVIGFISIAVTKMVYFVEDSFEKLPISWVWWPAIGGIAVGLAGYFSPHTLGVGYDNITNILSGNMAVYAVLSLCLLKFLSWVVALGSGTSGGTLAPLLTIGGATGVLLGSLTNYVYPSSGVTIPLAALVGMSAMFAGASRAFLTSIIFALETTLQTNALLPLLATSGAAYIVSFFLMENTIMTEKIARRGIKTPESYEPDILEKITVAQVMKEENGVIISEDNNIGEIANWLENEPGYNSNYFIVSDPAGCYKGIISASNLFSKHHNAATMVGTLIKRQPVSIKAGSSLRQAIELMAKENIDVLPVLATESSNVIGILSYKDIISGYKKDIEYHEAKKPHISLKRRSLKILLHGQKLINLRK
jgi:CIC family chloride channel protein